MKVLLINGSPHAKGCTYTALNEIAGILSMEGIDSEIVNIGGNISGGCKACGFCSANNRCVIDDALNGLLCKIRDADGYVFGSPVHYAAASGDIKSFMDRLFYSNAKLLAYKPAAAIVSARRGGTTSALEELNKYITINNMPLVSSQYWSMVHGNNPDEVRQDLEGMQIMRTIGHNMAWLLKCIELGRANGITPQYPEKRIGTNFIR